MKEKTYKTGFTYTQRKLLDKALSEFVVEHARKFGLPEEAVTQEIRYWQQSTSQWRTNPTQTEKKKSFRQWGARCWLCEVPIGAITGATFHHLRRGVSNLHSPENLVPLHRDKEFGCHEKLHNAPPGSLTAGSLRGR
ncbi:hypothetical protein HPC50_22090 [Corallococcus exiguus]|uniref:hypothetical protein n=1 Tax=Corallococcus TaxID=83461 RepID=UPI0011C3DBE6|nr:MULTISPECIES: hypothetical protein [Corallococcus]NPC49757.1 hypothetical protein [Corallococcus exiguus]